MAADVTPTPPPFGDLLRRLRLQAGLTQEALAERAGLSARGLSDLERGVRSAPRRDTLHLLLEALALAPTDRAALERAARRLGPAVRQTGAQAGSRGHDRRAFPAAGLPASLDPLFGRDRDMAAVAALLRDREARLVNLLGAGGVGKTSLAVRVAASLAPDFPDGFVFVPLAAVRDPALVLPTVAQALGVREAVGRDLEDALARALDGRRVLLVLDNLEQVLEAAPAIGTLIDRSPTLRVIATSRAPLRLSREQRYPVLPLEAPVPGLDAEALALAPNPAMQLFARKARQVRPDFAIAPENAGAIAAICHRLDGLPLAIELAAARIAILPPAALLSRLARGLPLLSGGDRDLPERLQTMRGAIAWSYDLLSPEDQVLFRQLAIFAGGFTFAATEGVCHEETDSVGALFEGITRLVEASLVQAIPGADGEPRFALLETIRDFGLEQLDAEEEAILRDRHARYLLTLAELAAPAVHGPEQQVWRNRLGDEMANLREALAWLERTAQADAMLRMIGALGDFWVHRGHLHEGHDWVERALATGGSPAPRITALFSGAVIAFIAGNFARSVSWTDEALLLVAESGDARLEGRFLYNQVTTAWMQGDLELARSRAERAIIRLREENDQIWLAWALSDIGTAMSAAGESDLATRWSPEGLALHRRLGNATGVAVKLMDDGAVAHAAGDVATAAAAYSESLEIWRDLGDSWWSASPLAGTAAVACSLGEFQQGARLLGVADRLRHASGAQPQPHEWERDAAAKSAAVMALGEEAYAGEYAIGRRLAPDDAIAEALGILRVCLARRDDEYRSNAG